MNLMNLLNCLSKNNIHFQDSLHHSQFLGLFNTRADANEAQKCYKSINSFKYLLKYLYEKYPEKKIPHYDYPFLFHYKNIFDKTKKKLIVNDFGGSFGPHYNAVSNFIPNTITEWNIYEEESIIEDLKKLNSSPTYSPEINFYKSNEEYRKCNFAYSSGSMQYYDINSPVELLAQIPEKPRYVIFNQIPLDNNIECNLYTAKCF